MRRKSAEKGRRTTCHGSDLKPSTKRYAGASSSFVSKSGGLPALPERPIDYEGWFQDVKKRIEMRSEKRTLIEHVEMAKRFNELHSQWLRLAHTNYELSRVNARASVEDAKIKLELYRIL